MLPEILQPANQHPAVSSPVPDNGHNASLTNSPARQLPGNSSDREALALSRLFCRPSYVNRYRYTTPHQRNPGRSRRPASSTCMSTTNGTAQQGSQSTTVRRQAMSMALQTHPQA